MVEQVPFSHLELSLKVALKVCFQFSRQAAQPWWWLVWGVEHLLSWSPARPPPGIQCPSCPQVPLLALAFLPWPFTQHQKPDSCRLLAAIS